MKNILISGGAGYIGSSIANLLIEKKYKVTIIDNLSNGYKHLIPKKAIFYKYDIADIKKIKMILKDSKYDFLIHLAAFIKVEESILFPKKYFNNNVIKSKIFLKTCLENGLDNIIFSSTATVYKSKKELLSENSKLKPKSPYAKNKLEIEKFLKNFTRKNKKKIFILRYFNVVGAYKSLKTGQISKKSTHLFKILSEYIIGKRKKFFINGNNFTTHDGTAVRDFIDINDLCLIHLLIIKHSKKLKTTIFNCGYGKGLSVMSIFLTAKKIFPNISFFIKDRRKGDPESLVANVKRLKKLLNFKPKFNDIKKSILSSVKWEEKINKKKYYLN